MFKVDIVGYEVITLWATIDVCVIDKAFFFNFYSAIRVQIMGLSEHSSLRTAKNTFKDVI